jgi:glycosyltransferase involved in cell wall biosynthesis
MGMGVPIICNDNVGDVGTIIKETGAGYAINEFSNKAYQTAIAQIDDLLKIDPDKIRQAAMDRFSLEIGVERYAQVYERL